MNGRDAGRSSAVSSPPAAPGPAEVETPFVALRFGSFELDLRSGELRKGGVLLRLQQQPSKVLSLLAVRCGELVTREEIQRQIWGEGTFVDFEQGLNFCIKQIRSVLGDDANAPRFLETLPRRGYRFVAPVTRVEAERGRRRPGLLSLGVATVAVLGLSLLRDHLRFPVRAATGKVMLAVLPFENLNADKDQDYFSDGLTEEMITRLGRLQPTRLGVIARTSSLSYKGQRKPVDQVGRELGVDYVLEGSVRRSGDRLKVAAQLIQVSDQTHLWAEGYERDASDPLAIQDEVAGRIARSLQARLVPDGPQSRAATPAAYEAYLKGRYELSRRQAQGLKSEGLPKSVPYFEEAIAADPRFAPAYAGLASAYVALTDEGMAAPTEVMPKAKAAADKALEFDPGLAEAYTARAVVRTYFDWDWGGARSDFERALELEPNQASIHHAYAGYLSALGRNDEAIAAMKRAQALDPLSSAVNGDVGWYYYFARRYDEALAQYRRALELEPGLKWIHGFMIDAYEQNRMLPEARAKALEVMRSAGDPPAEIAEVARLDAAAGLRLFWNRALAFQLRKKQPSAAFVFARYASLGEKEQAFAWLETACQVRSRWLVALFADPRVDALRSDPRFEAYRRRVGLAAAASR